MAAISDYLENKLLNHIFRGSSFEKPLTIAIALTTDVAKDNQDGSTIPEVPSVDTNGFTTNYSRINLLDPAEEGDTEWSEVGVDNTTSYEVYLDSPRNFSISDDEGVSFDVSQGSGYYYPLFLNSSRAGLEPGGPQYYTVKFEDDFPGVEFYTPRLTFASGVENSSSLLSYEGNGFIKNEKLITFNDAITDWGWVSGIAILDSEVIGEGNLLMYAPLRSPRDVKAGDSLKFDIKSLEISLT